MTDTFSNRYRDTWCGLAEAGQVGSKLRVAGWVHRRRDHGGLIFIDLRDREGILQLVFRPDEFPEAHAAAHRLRPEHVISATGTLLEREAGAVNPDLPTGAVELNVEDFDLLATAETPPFQIDEDDPVSEELRLQYRYLDLRKAGHGRRHRAAPPGGVGHPPPPGGPRLPGHRDAGAHALHAGGRARLPGAQPGRARVGVRAAPVAPDLQAAADDRRLRALLPDRPLLPGRVLARRPPARVHPAGRGAGLRGRGRRDRHHRPADARGAGPRRRPGARPDRADGLRRGPAALRQRPPGPPDPVRDRRPRAGVRGRRVQGVQRRAVLRAAWSGASPRRVSSRARTSTS